MEPLNLGPDVVAMLLPQRPPFLMVDRVVAYRGPTEPALRTQRFISANEAVFEGHFPNLKLWPGVYTLEGLGQSCNLLGILLGLQVGGGERGFSPAEVLAALRNEQLRAALQPGYDPALSERFRAALPAPRARIGMTAELRVKLLQPVFAGQRLDYEVRLLRRLGQFLHFELEAAVDGRVVARGTQTSAIDALRSGAP